jgi:hypothetical protein
MDLPTRSIWKIISSANSAGRRITLVGVVATSKFLDSGIREVVEALGVRSDLTPAKSSPPMFEGPVVEFQGTVTSGKLPKVKEKPTVASIWVVMLAEKTTLVLATIELDV